MFDTMTIIKIGGGVLGAFLIYLVANTLTHGYYTIGTAGGHGDEAEHAQGYVIASHGDDTHDAAVVEEVPFSELLAAADPAKGEKVFGKCKACHKLEPGANGTGPELHGVVGRDVASVAGFGYSDAVAGLGGTWDADRLNEWLTDPKAYAPGNKMTFKGLSKETDRANLIAYLATIGG